MNTHSIWILDFYTITLFCQLTNGLVNVAVNSPSKSYEFDNKINTELRLQGTGREWIPSENCPWQNTSSLENMWGKCNRKMNNGEEEGFYLDPLLVETQQSTSIFCAIYKSGSTAWRRVILKALGKGKTAYLASDVHQIYIPQLQDIPVQRYRKTLNDDGVVRWIVVRNPYMRLFSAYSEKFVRGNPDTIQQYHQKFDLEYTEGNSASFEDFVKRLYLQYQEKQGLLRRQRVNRTKVVTDAHFAWQTSFCGMRKGFGFDYVLKSELLAEWYPTMIDVLNMTQVVMSGWPDKDKCLMSVPSLACNGPLITSHFVLNHTEKETHQEQEQLQHEVSFLHRRGSKLYLLDAYNNDVAKMVTEMYYEDLVRLGYPIWDGQQHTFQIV